MAAPPYSPKRSDINLPGRSPNSAAGDTPAHGAPSLSEVRLTEGTAAADRAADAELLRRLRLGDERALELVFRAHYPAMVAVVRRIVFAPDVAEELVQDVFFKLWTKRETLAEIDALKTYLYRAARNTALNHLRRLKLEQAHEEREAAKGEPVTIEATDDSATASEVTEAVHAAINRLPTRCREIFLMSREGGLTYGEIAAELGISIKTVETQMGRALKSLRLSLSQFRVG
ncbi:MAG: RNA polymerase sigma-70 factor [Cytophagaceae bacterium]|nr:RNA polymerase sigma-70 factor [Gemmatimonadaceae bacterium]